MAIEGICDICGKEGEVFCAGETYVCAECAEESYFWCTRCDGLYPKEDAIVYHLKDGRELCEDCAISMLNESTLSEDDIDHICYPDGFDEDEEEE